ncbi:unnamed protein product, partial [Didymodactylos carnosus]
IVGFDIILTEELKPVLLEVNANPSLRMDFEKQTEPGKVIYQQSMIDEEIKKPLVLETLKLALPKKKLHTIARHYQMQLNDEMMAQRLEKVAQRRIDERSEKIRSARQIRFDPKHNPYFSRPPREMRRDDLEQQQQKVLLNPFPSANGGGKESEDDQLMSSFAGDDDSRIEKPKKLTVSCQKKQRAIDDDESNGNQLNRVIPSMSDDDENGLNPNSIFLLKKQRRVGSSTTTGITRISTARETKVLKLIYPSTYKSKYRHLFLLDKIAYIYIKIVVMMGYKRMTAIQFRNFAQICGIINDFITRESIDILYVQMLRKWQQFILKTTSSGLPFGAFIEAFFLLSQRKFPSTKYLLDSVNQMVIFCVRHLNIFLESPFSHYLLPRTSRNCDNNNQTVDGRYDKLVRSHRLTTAPSNHGTTSAAIAVVSTQTTANTTTSLNVSHDTSVRTTTTRVSSSVKNSKRSVFPLFFEVL